MKVFVHIIGVALVAVAPAIGEIPSLLNYQGKLTDSGGNPVAGTVEVTVAIYTNPTDAAAQKPQTSELDQ
jgi:hypothetical protein